MAQKDLEDDFGWSKCCAPEEDEGAAHKSNVGPAGDGIIGHSKHLQEETSSTPRQPVANSDGIPNNVTDALVGPGREGGDLPSVSTGGGGGGSVCGDGNDKEEKGPPDAKKKGEITQKRFMRVSSKRDNKGSPEVHHSNMTQGLRRVITAGGSTRSRDLHRGSAGGGGEDGHNDGREEYFGTTNHLQVRIGRGVIVCHPLNVVGKAAFSSIIGLE